ncbi:MAG: D-alanyl-D-alanine carboxypeptidase [Clostridia bacterium]|nr:D-alanyl-D-alanine carboxypeptidase [Clostridia bacterium]
MPHLPIPKKKSSKAEIALAVVLLVTVLFEVILTVVLLVRSFSAPDQPTDSIETFDPLPDEEEPLKSPILTDATADLKDQTSVNSKYVLLMNADTWEVVAQKNATVQFSPASMTKVMTLLVACNNLTEADLEKKLLYSQEVVNYVSTGDYAGTSFSLPRDDPNKPGITYMGDRFTMRSMLYGVGVSSAADCTYMVIREIAGTEQAFVEMMNETAKELGLQNTHFNNAVGFESADNYTTAADMATIMAHAMQNELIVDILKVRTADYKIKGYYTENGVEATYDISLKPSINSRLKHYEDFLLTSTELETTKTGFTTGSYLVCTVVHKTTKTRYILVVGEADTPAATQSGMFKDTMLDIEYICNTYIK